MNFMISNQNTRSSMPCDDFLNKKFQIQLNGMDEFISHEFALT